MAAGSGISQGLLSYRESLPRRHARQITRSAHTDHLIQPVTTENPVDDTEVDTEAPRNLPAPQLGVMHHLVGDWLAEYSAKLKDLLGVDYTVLDLQIAGEPWDPAGAADQLLLGRDHLEHDILADSQLDREQTLGLHGQRDQKLAASVLRGNTVPVQFDLCHCWPPPNSSDWTNKLLCWQNNLITQSEHHYFCQSALELTT